MVFGLVQCNHFDARLSKKQPVLISPNLPGREMLISKSVNDFQHKTTNELTHYMQNFMPMRSLKIYLVCSFLFFIFIAIPCKAQLINERSIKQDWKTDQSKHLVALNEFRVLLVRDGIKPIDHPKFWTIDTAKVHYFNNEPVSVVEINGKARAYPLSVLMFHEIVNDSLNGRLFSVTYCPLCNSSLVFNRTLRWKNQSFRLSFGTTGMLRKSNLVMWDRQSETWWQQFTGKALVGKFAGASLEFLPSMVLSLKEFGESFPKGLVLSTESGNIQTQKRYGTNPYVNYDALSTQKPRLFFDEVDTRLPAMERVVHVSADSIERGYTLSALKKLFVINDKIGDTPVVLFYEPGTRSVLDKSYINKGRNIGTVTVFSSVLNEDILIFRHFRKGFIDQQTGSSWDITGHCVKGKLKGKKLLSQFYSMDFAFAWFSFYPNATLYKPKK